VVKGQNSKNPKKWWEKTFRRCRDPSSKNLKKWWKKTFQEVKVKVQNIRKNDEKRRFRRWI
jgi:hypothetical protein